MKHKVVGILAAAAVLLVGISATLLGAGSPHNRVHQHLTARQPDAGCTCDHSTLCTHLPLVVIDTNGEPVPGEPLAGEDENVERYTCTADGEKMLKATVRVMSDDSHNHHPTDTPDLESNVLIRVRGNSSRYFDKKAICFA